MFIILVIGIRKLILLIYFYFMFIILLIGDFFENQQFFIVFRLSPAEPHFPILFPILVQSDGFIFFRK